MYAKANADYYTGLQSPYPYAWSLLVRAHPGAMPRLLHLLRSPRRPTWVIGWQPPDRWQPRPQPCHRARAARPLPRGRAPPWPPDLPPHLLPSQIPPQKEPPMTTAWVVLPTYNERENLTTVVTLARAALASCDPPVSGTVLIVDDGSPDGTGELADQLAREHARRPRPPPGAQGRPRRRLPRRLRRSARERRRLRHRDGRRPLARPGRPPAPDRRRAPRRRRRPRLPLRGGRRRGGLAAAPPADLARRRTLRRDHARPPAQRPHRRLQVLPRERAAQAGPGPRPQPRLRVPDRADLPRRVSPPGWRSTGGAAASPPRRRLPRSATR